MSNVANEIAAAAKALPPEQAAEVIYRTLFENGPGRLSGENKFIAMGVITTGLIAWRKQILAAKDAEAAEWKKLYHDAKAELDAVRLKLSILLKEK